MKACTKCGETKPREMFHKRAASPDGLQHYCKPCTVTYRAANADKVKANKAVWYAANADKVKANKAVWYAANADKVKARTVAWQATNTDKVKASNAAWRAANTDKVRACRAKRRATQRGATIGNISASTWADLRNTCEVFKLLTGEPHQIDHKVALADGGTHLVDNLDIVSAAVNASKGAARIEDLRAGTVAWNYYNGPDSFEQITYRSFRIGNGTQSVARTLSVGERSRAA